MHLLGTCSAPRQSPDTRGSLKRASLLCRAWSLDHDLSRMISQSQIIFTKTDRALGRQTHHRGVTKALVILAATLSAILFQFFALHRLAYMYFAYDPSDVLIKLVQWYTHIERASSLVSKRKCGFVHQCCFSVGQDITLLRSVRCQ